MDGKNNGGKMERIEIVTRMQQRLPIDFGITIERTMGASGSEWASEQAKNERKR